jgi:hypothetical protein
MHKVIDHKLTLLKGEIAAFCQRHHILKLALFGSALRSEFRADSDIDILVEFEPDHIPGLLELVGMEHELSEMFDKRRVDLRTAEDLSRHFRDRIISEAVVQYEVA